MQLYLTKAEHKIPWALTPQRSMSKDHNTNKEDLDVIIIMVF